MWAHLDRDVIEVARCAVERLMKANGWCGVNLRQEDPHDGSGSGRDPGTGPGRAPSSGARTEPAASR
jgi:hypothetical protein